MARLPAIYLNHGGGPWPFGPTPFGSPEESLALRKYLAGISAIPATPPRALLVFSAHWEEAVPTLMTAEHPPMLYDYYGFAPEAYQLRWPAPGAPGLVERVEGLLHAAGFRTARDDRRGYDHGTFVPLKLAWPEPTIPTLQVSLLNSLDPAEHLALGRAVAPLRDEGVFVLGSGSSFHNLRHFRDPDPEGRSDAFDAWLQDTTRASPAEREARLLAWDRAPHARWCHPREEHLLPLMVVAGAAGQDAGRVPFAGRYCGHATSAHQFG